MEEKFEYFMTETNKRLDKIDEKLEQLISFRLMLVGASMAGSLICTFAFNLIYLWMRS